MTKGESFVFALSIADLKTQKLGKRSLHILRIAVRICLRMVSLAYFRGCHK